MDTFLVDTALKDGRQARMRGLLRRANPYCETGSSLKAMFHAAWTIGWLQAHLAEEAKEAKLVTARSERARTTWRTELRHRR